MRSTSISWVWIVVAVVLALVLLGHNVRETRPHGLWEVKRISTGMVYHSTRAPTRLESGQLLLADSTGYTIAVYLVGEVSIRQVE